MEPSQITDWCHEIIRIQAPAGGLYVDATMGNGKDTAFLCSLAGEKGHVLAFDIQRCAIDATRELLGQKGYAGRARLLLDGHENLDRYVADSSVDVISVTCREGTIALPQRQRPAWLPFPKGWLP